MSVLVGVFVLMPHLAWGDGPPFSSTRTSVTKSFDVLGGESTGSAQSDANTGRFFIHARTTSDAQLAFSFGLVSAGTNSVTSFIEFTESAPGLVSPGVHNVAATLALSRVSASKMASGSASLYVTMQAVARSCPTPSSCRAVRSPVATEYLACTQASSYCAPRSTLTIQSSLDCPATCSSMVAYVWIYAIATCHLESCLGESIGEGNVTSISL